MINKKRLLIPLLLVLILSLLSLSCSPSNQIQLLSGIVAAVDIAIPVINAAYPGMVPAQINDYVSAVLTAVSDISKSWGSATTDAERSVLVLKELANLANTNSLTVNLPPLVKAVINGISSAISAFIAPYTTQTQARLPSITAFKAKLTMSDKRALANINNRVGVIKAKLHAVHAAHVDH
jgi:hypothetical protein